MSKLILLFWLLLLWLLGGVHTGHQSLHLLHHHLHLLLTIWHLLDSSTVGGQELHDVRDLHHLLLILQRGWRTTHLRKSRGWGLRGWSLRLYLLCLLLHDCRGKRILRCLPQWVLIRRRLLKGIRWDVALVLQGI